MTSDDMRFTAPDTGWYAVIQLPHRGLEVMIGDKLVPSHDGKIKIGFESHTDAARLLTQIVLGLEEGTVDGKPVVAGEVIHEQDNRLAAPLALAPVPDGGGTAGSERESG
jgi:hypothetical protein